jgi:uncharacterized membrane protein YeiH
MFTQHRALCHETLTESYTLARKFSLYLSKPSLRNFPVAATSKSDGSQAHAPLRGWPIVTAALLGAFTTFFAFHIVEEIPEHALTVVDALGLSLLAVSGTEKALAFRLTPIAAVMMGGISGAGGYTIRDIPLAEVPAILRVDFLATAAIIGAVVVVIARSVKAPANIAALLGGATCFGLRIVAVWQHWHLPTLNLH